jgi:hypothetical protein
MDQAARSPEDRLPMHSSPRCGARTRAGQSCLAPAVKDKCRCRMHGGAKGSGAPKGNKNALKHGVYTRETRDERRRLRKLMADALKTLKEFE